MATLFWSVLLLLGAALAAPQPALPELPAELVDWPVSVLRPKLSPDGRFVAFASALDGPMDLFVADLRTGDVRRLTDTESDDTRPAWSPDGTELVYHSNRAGTHDLWILTLDSGATRRITRADGTEYLPDWSPQGDWIAYLSDAAGSWDIWIVRPDGTDARRLTTNAGNEYFPRFSPDGTQIVFYSTWTLWTDIYIVNVADGAVHEVLRGEFEDFRPDWSADGTEIVFASDRSDPTGLWVVPAAGGEPRPLLTSTHGLDNPDWSADGTSILYSETEFYGHLFQTDLDGGTPRRITPDMRTVLDRHPDVSPDGTLIAYETSRHGNEGNVALRGLSATVEERVSSGRISDGMPRFSPSGDRIVFTRGGGGQQSYNAVVRDLKTGSETAWTDTGNVRYANFCGEDAIVFGWTEVSYAEPLELWRKTRGQPAERVGEHLIEFGGIECDAAGEWIVASIAAPPGAPETAPRLVRIDIASGQSRVLTRGDTPHRHPRLSPDGQQIVFVAEEDNGSAALVVPAVGGTPRRVIDGSHGVTAADWAGPGSLVYSAGRRREAVKILAVAERPDAVSEQGAVSPEASRQLGMDSDPVVSAGPPGAWDHGGVIAQWVDREADRYQMFYLGLRTHQPRTGRAIGYATSADGIVWNKSAANPVVSAETFGVPGAEVYQVVPVSLDDTQWVLYAVVGTPAPGEVWRWDTGTMTTLRLVSQDAGSTWTSTEVEGLERGPEGSWDSSFVVPRAYVHEGGTHYLLYDGSDLSDWMIGLARSSDGTVWSKLSAPVFAYGPVACGSHSNFVGSSIRRRGSGWDLLYTGGPQGCSDSLRTVGMAAADHLEGPWLADPANPILPPQQGTVMVSPVGLTDAAGNELLYISLEDETDGFRPMGVFRAVRPLPETAPSQVPAPPQPARFRLEQGPIVMPGAADTWDAGSVFGPRVIGAGSGPRDAARPDKKERTP
jgi:Tol biopolymer transport system component